MIRSLWAGFAAFCVLSPGLAAAAQAAPASTSAHWARYGNRALGFGFKYPANWHLTYTPRIPPSNTATVVVSYQGAMTYSLTAAVWPIKPARSLARTAHLYTAYAAKTAQTVFAHLHWTKTSLGRMAALVGIAKSPPTEGGVGLSQAVYLTQRRGHVYTLVLQAQHNPPYTRLGQFPAIYRQIIGTWRFL